MRGVRVRLTLVLFFFSSLPAAAQDPQMPVTIPEMWDSWCGRCHGQDGSGRVTEAAITVQPMDFTDCRVASPEPDADWELAIVAGGPSVGLSSQMPAFGDALTREQIGGFVDHIRSFCSESGWPHGNLNLPRPIFTEKAFPENEVVILPRVTHGLEASDGRRASAVDLTSIYERRMGRRGMWEVTLPLASHEVAGDRNGGVGDVELAVKYVLHTDRAHSRIVSGGLELKVPTGSERRGLGEGTTVLEPYLALGTIVRETYLQGQIKIELPWREPWKGRELVYNAYVGRDTSNTPDTWTIGIELNGADREVAVTPQVRRGLTRTGALAAALGVRLPVTHRKEQGTQWVGYLLWEYLEPVRAAP